MSQRSTCPSDGAFKMDHYFGHDTYKERPKFTGYTVGMALVCGFLSGIIVTVGLQMLSSLRSFPY